MIEYCKYPVLLCAFNRPELTKQVLSSIRIAQPPKLYFSCDGPRWSEDEPKVNEVRRLIELIDWPCRIEVRFSDVNQGCGKSIHDAIHWFFRYEDAGIILEDDTVPLPEFFQFTGLNLERYKNDTSISGILGSNMIPPVALNLLNDENQKSKYFFPWGWASWRRALDSFSIDEQSWSVDEYDRVVNNLGLNAFEREYWKSLFNKAFTGTINTWDYQFMYSAWITKGSFIHPPTNMIKNIGFGAYATHTFQNIYSASDHKINEHKLIEQLRFNSIYNQNWSAYRNHAMESIIYEKMIQYKREITRLDSILKTPKLAFLCFIKSCIRSIIDIIKKTNAKS